MHCTKENIVISSLLITWILLLSVSDEWKHSVLTVMICCLNPNNMHRLHERFHSNLMPSLYVCLSVIQDDPRVKSIDV